VERSSGDCAQAGQGLEVLEEHLRQSGKIRTVADTIEIRDEPMVGTIHKLSPRTVEDARGLEDDQMPEKLLPVEVRQRASFRGVQKYLRKSAEVDSTIIAGPRTCQASARVRPRL